MGFCVDKGRLNKFSAYIALIILVILLAIQSLYYYRTLLERVPVSYDKNGDPDGYDTSGSYVALDLIVVIGSILVAILASVYGSWCPLYVMNLPNRAEIAGIPYKVHIIVQDISVLILWMGVNNTVFFLILFQVIFEGFAQETQDFQYVIYIFLAIWAIITGGFVWAFRKMQTLIGAGVWPPDDPRWQKIKRSAEEIPEVPLANDGLPASGLPNLLATANELDKERHETHSTKFGHVQDENVEENDEEKAVLVHADAFAR